MHDVFHQLTVILVEALTFKMQKMRIDELKNSVDLDEVAHNEVKFLQP